MKINWATQKFFAAWITLAAGCSWIVVGIETGQPPVPLASDPDNNRDGFRQVTSKHDSKTPVCSSQAGIGIALRIEKGKVLVSKVLPDTPAALSNLIKPNDQIVAIAEGNAKPTVVTGEKELARVVGLVRGPLNSVIRLTIIPEGKKEADSIVVNLVRGNIKEIDTFFDGRLLPIGAKAPNFKFIRLSDGQQSDLSQFAGRIVVVEFWAAWCGPCIKATDELNSLQTKHPEWTRQVELLAINVDDKKEDTAKIIKSARWTNVSIGWAGPAALQQYRVAGLPTVFVIDREGNVAAVDHRLDIPSTIALLLKRSKK